MKLTPALLIPVAIAIGGGLIEMRCAIARLETSVADIDHRVTHLEERLDERRVSASDL